MPLPILAIGDTHLPWGHGPSLKKVIQLAELIKPKIIVQIGDLYDLYAYSRFARSHNVFTPQQETTLGRKQAEAFWKALQRAAPKASCHQLLGNHDERLVRKAMTNFPEILHLLERTGLWQFDGVLTQTAERDELMLGDICVLHGYRQHGDHVKYNQQSTILGHTHLGGVVYHRLRGKTIWELNCGHLANEHAVPMSYTQQKRISKMTRGVGVVDEFGPRFIAF